VLLTVIPLVLIAALAYLGSAVEPFPEPKTSKVRLPDLIKPYSQKAAYCVSVPAA
jgi:hypothetical protein